MIAIAVIAVGLAARHQFRALDGEEAIRYAADLVRRTQPEFPLEGCKVRAMGVRSLGWEMGKTKHLASYRWIISFAERTGSQSISVGITNRWGAEVIPAPMLGVPPVINITF